MYSGGQAWAGAHDVWLSRTQPQLCSPAKRAAFESDYDAMITATARRNRFDALTA